MCTFVLLNVMNIFRRRVLRNSASFFFMDVNECANNPCKNGATCANTIEGFNCTCTKGFQGQICNKGRSYNFVADL